MISKESQQDFTVTNSYIAPKLHVFIIKRMFIAVEKYYISCLYTPIIKFVLRCFLNEEIVVINLISIVKQFCSIGAAVTKSARSPAVFLECGCFSTLALLVDLSSRRKVSARSVSTLSEWLRGKVIQVRIFSFSHRRLQSKNQLKRYIFIF